MKNNSPLWMVVSLCAGVPCAALADVPAPAKIAPTAPVADPAPIASTELEVDTGAATSSAVWEAMQRGKMTPEDAWEKGLLDAASVQAGLIAGSASGEDDKSKKLRLTLGGVLVQHAPELLADTTKLAKQVQLAIADSYANQRDEKAAPLYEAVLKQTQAPYEQGLVLCALGEFWSRVKQPQKAQEVFERGRQALTGNHPHFAAEMLIRAARSWTQNGDEDKARLLYARVEKEGDGWMTGMAIYDQSKTLLDEGKDAEARKLLQQPLSGNGAERVKIGLLSLLASSFERTGEEKQAVATAQQAIATYQTLAVTGPDGGLKLQVEWARQIMVRCQEHLKEGKEKTKDVSPPATAIAPLSG